MSAISESTLENIKELRKSIQSANGSLTKSRISPDDYFVNLSYETPRLEYPDVGISRTVVNICDQISTLLLEDEDGGKSIVLIFEYYFLVAPILFKSQGAKLVNDIVFMKHFMRYIRSLCPTTRKDFDNILASLEVYDPIKGY